MQNPRELEAKVEGRHRTILILWFALLMSITIFFVMTRLIPSNSAEPNAVLSYALIGLAFTSVIVSILIKQRFVQRAIQNRDAAILQTGYIMSFALSESAALFGLVDHFVTGSKYYLFAFVLGLLGMLLHFPKKDHVRATIA